MSLSVRQIASAFNASERQVKRWRNDPSFPRSNNIDDVREWLTSRATKTATAKSGIEEERRARIEKIKAQTAIISGEYSPKADQDRAAAKLCFMLRREHQAAAMELSTRLVGLSAAQARVEIENRLRKIHDLIESGVWAKT